MLKTIPYSWHDKEPLTAANLNRRTLDIDLRIHALEGLQLSWQSAISSLENMGLSRINTVLMPLVEESTQLLATLKLERVSLLTPATSVSYAYDEQGRIEQVTSHFAEGDEVVRYHYTEAGKIEQVVTTRGAITHTTRYRYNTSGHIEQVSTVESIR